MTAIRNTPANVKDYRQDMRDAFTIELERCKLTYDELANSISDKRDAILPNVDKFIVNITDYPEFQQNTYINGRLETIAKGMYEDKRNDMFSKHLCFRLVSYAVDLRKISELKHKIEIYEKCLMLDGIEYKKIINTFYTTVQNKMILEGKGYRLEGKLGYICINRVINTGKVVPDYAATNKKRKELEQQGVRIWNEDEAKFAKENGLPYDAVKPPVIYKQDEAWYELALCSCTLWKGFSYKLKFIDYRHNSVRQYSNDDLIRISNNDKTKICQLPISMKIKLSLCLKVDNILYTKFIRNDAQTKCGFISNHRKGGQ